MLVFKCAQVVVVARQEPKPWTMEGRSGVSHSARLAVIGMNATAENIVLKAKTAEELEKKIGLYPANGKACEIPIKDCIATFKAGDKKPSGYEYVG